MANFNQAVKWMEEGKSVRILSKPLMSLHLYEGNICYSSQHHRADMPEEHSQSTNWVICGDKYPMGESQDAQIDCRKGTCVFYQGAGVCSNISPAITLNPDKTFVCWSEKSKDTILSDKVHHFGLESPFAYGFRDKDIITFIEDIELENQDLKSDVLDLIKIQKGSKEDLLSKLKRLFEMHKIERDKLAGDGLI